jgi:prepilin-type N-terminal cleavage/methylation domain-containing protein
MNLWPIPILTSSCPRRGRRDSYRNGRGSTPAHPPSLFLHSGNSGVRYVKPLPSPLLGLGEGIRKVNAKGISEHGFTLIEMMLAIGVLGLILAMLSTSFSTVAHSKVHAEGRLIVDREGRALLWQISKEVRDAVQTPIAPSHVLLLGGGHSGGSGPLDTLTLSTLDAGHRRSITGIAPEYIVSYSEVSNPDRRGWYLLQRTQQSGLLLSGNGGQSLVLANNLLSLHLRYFDGQRWTESWDSTSLPPGRQLPVAVAIQIQMAGPGGRPIDFATQVTVPMAIAQW